MPSDMADGLDTVSVTLRLVSPSTASSLGRRAARQRRDGMPSDVADGLDAVSIILRLCEPPHRGVTRKKSREAGGDETACRVTWLTWFNCFFCFISPRGKGGLCVLPKGMLAIPRTNHYKMSRGGRPGAVLGPSSETHWMLFP